MVLTIMHPIVFTGMYVMIYDHTPPMLIFMVCPSLNPKSSFGPAGSSLSIAFVVFSRLKNCKVTCFKNYKHFIYVKNHYNFTGIHNLTTLCCQGSWCKKIK